MKKCFYIFISFLFLQSSIFASQEYSVSCCQKLNIYCNSWIAKNLLGKTDQDILTHAASLQDPTAFKLCIALHIGDLYEKDSEGHTPKSVAELCGNHHVLHILNSPRSVAYKKIKEE